MKDTCTFELRILAKRLPKDKIASADSNYKCPHCGQERSIKELSIDLTLAGVTATLRNARYDQLIGTHSFFLSFMSKLINYVDGGQTYDEKNDEFKLSDGMLAKIEKASVITAVDEEFKEIVKDGAPLHTSFMLLKNPEASLKSINSELKSKLAAAHTEISNAFMTAKENIDLFADIFGESPFTSNLSFNELKEGLGIFEYSELRFDPKQLKDQKLVFCVNKDKDDNDMLNIHYPGLGLTFLNVKLTLNNSPFKIPPGAKLTTFVDKPSMITKILITGGVSGNLQKSALPTIYEVSFTPETEDGKTVLKQASVQEKNSCRTAKYSHSIVWHPKNEQVFMLGGVGNPREPTKTLEIGEKDKGDWIWYQGKELQKPRVSGSACVTEKYIYIFGGYVKKHIDDYPKIGQGLKLAVVEIERFDLETNKSEIIKTLGEENVLKYTPYYSLCFPNSFERPDEIIILGGKNQNARTFDVKSFSFNDDKAKIEDFSTLAGNEGWTIHMGEVVTMMPSEQQGFKLLKYNLTKRFIQYSELKN